MKHKVILLDPHPWLAKNYTYEKYSGKVPIDQDLASITTYLWNHGIITLSSCQACTNIIPKKDYKNSKDHCWIRFRWLSDLRKFVSLCKKNMIEYHKLIHLVESARNELSSFNIYFPRSELIKFNKLIKLSKTVG